MDPSSFPMGVVKEGSILIMAVGNSRFAGGGYEVAPQAILTDGFWTLLWSRDCAPGILAALLGN